MRTSAARNLPRKAVFGLSLLSISLILAGVTLAQSRKEDTAARVPDDCASSPDVACLRAAYSRPRARWPAPKVLPGAIWSELDVYPDKPDDPPDNISTPEKVALGRKLFEDPRLSRSAQIACASCHDPQLGWGDGRRTSFGHDRQLGRRNAISIATSAHASSLFWNGRSGTLEDQALHPITDDLEMAFSQRALERRLNRVPEYRSKFREVFGSDRIGAQDIARALAAYERSLSPPGSRYERFIRGSSNALNDQQLLGLHVFRTRAGCMNCHSGPMLTDGQFHNLGLHFYGRRRQDLGRYEVTKDPADSGRFRTPSLRNVSRTGPWMHNGLFNQLRGVINFYAAGGARPRPKAHQLDDPAFPRPDPLLQPQKLSKEEIDALEAFLEAL